MFSVLRTFGRSLTHSHSCANPISNPKEIQLSFASLSRAFSRKPSKGKIGYRIRKANADAATDGSVDNSAGALLLKPALFTVATCTCAFSAAAIYKYEDYVRHHHHDRQLREYQSFSSKINRFFEGAEGGRSEWRQQASRYWSRFSTGEKMALGCIWLNVCVYAGWRGNNPAVQRIMHRYFTASVYGKSPCASMLLSTFSHTNLTHLAVNMICLWSFAPTIVNLLGKEQAAALYVSAGMSSSMASYILNFMRASTVVSVGASGDG